MAPPYPSLAALVALDPVSRFRELYEGARTYEAALPLTLNGAPFGSIRLGVSTTLLRRELGASLRQSLTLAGIALPLAWVAAMILARLTLRPVRALAGEVDRIRRGEFSAEPAAAGGDEFQELSAQLQRLGREMHADRLATLSEKAQMQHVVDQLEDGVIFLSREMRILFFNKAAEEVVGRPLEQAVGQPLAELLPASHPLRPLVEGALEGGGGIRNATLAMAVGERRRECLVSAFPGGGCARGDGRGRAAQGSRVDQDRPVARELFRQARRARATHLGGRPRGEESAQRDGDPRRALEGPPRGRPGGGAERASR